MEEKRPRRSRRYRLSQKRLNVSGVHANTRRPEVKRGVTRQPHRRKNKEITYSAMAANTIVAPVAVPQ
jgi:hypothetical protein